MSGFYSKKINLLLFLCCFNLVVLFSQDRYLEIRAVAELEMNPLKGATVTLYENNEKKSSVITGSDGVFTFKLDVNKLYTVEVSKESFVSKRISFDTKIPDEEKGFWVRDFSISVVKTCEGVDYSVLSEPVDIIRFNIKRKDFESDKDYSAKMQSKLGNVYMQYDQCVQDKYRKFIAQADKQFNAKVYEQAKSNYEEALKVLPDEAYPKKRIEEINQLLKNQTNSENAYKQTINEADALLSQKQYEEALNKYKEAQALKPQDIYSGQKVSEIQSILTKNLAEQQQKQSQETQYNNLITKGNSEMANKNYAAAKQAFQQALVIKPNETSIKSKISELDIKIAEQAKTLEKQKELDANYAGTIAQADKEFAAGNYEAAKSLYLQASSLKPMEKYATTKAAEADKIVLANKASAEKAKIAENEKQFQTLLAQGDNLFKAKDLKGAAEAYNKALLLKPGESYPMQRVSQIKNTLEAEESKKQKDIEAGFQSAMASAEKAASSKDYQEARSFYLQAQQLKPENELVRNKIVEMDNLLALDLKQKQQIQNNYKESVHKADQLFNTKNYDAAKTAYQEAKRIKPDEQYPSLKIQEIDKIIAADQAKKQQEIQQGYQTAITSANALFTQKKYTEAKESYQKALTFKPEDILAKNKITEIENIVAQEMAKKADFEAKKKEYDAGISKADLFFTAKNYTSAKAEYQRVSLIMPTEQYPKQKITEIDKILLAEEQKKKDTEASYQKAIGAGNSFLAQKAYENAKKSFQEALTYKPEDITAKSKITEIDNLIKQDQAKLAAEELKKKQYNDLILSADKLLAAKSYAPAKVEYQKALQIIATEPYPKQKITEIDQMLLAEEQKKKDAEASYQKAISTGNSFLAQKAYENAKKSFQEALTYKPEDIAAKSKIIEIDNLIKQDQAKLAAEELKKKQYNDLILSADKLLAAKSYAPAKAEYQKALQIIPTEQYPKTKISEIDNLIAEQQKQAAELLAKENAYKSALTKGDDYFNKKQYDLSKAEYNKALEIKPTEVYPKNKINEIDNLLNQAKLAKEKDLNYTTSITEADRLFNEKNYTGAKTVYNQALTYKPAEAYPKSQIAKIDNILAEAEKAKLAGQAAEQQYSTYINQGDKLFNALNYVASKEQYKKALELKPNEAYPKARIAKIDENLALLSQKKETGSNPQKQETSANKPLLAELNFKNDSERDNYLAELKKKFPEGVTEEVYKEKNKITTRVIVIRLGEAREFRQVYFPSWGGNEFTLNGKPITQMFYNEQVKAKGGEYYKKFEF